MAVKPLVVMVTGAGGATGQGLIKSLQMSERRVRLVAANSDAEGAGLFWADVRCLLPLAFSDDYIDALSEALIRYRVQALFLGTPHEVLVVSRVKSQVERATGATIICADAEPVKIASDKWLTYDFLRNNQLNYPETARLADASDVVRFVEKVRPPYLIKPRFGTGSRRIRRIDSRVEIDTILDDERGDCVLQEYVGQDEEEYTVGVFMSRDSVALGAITIKRKLAHGLSVAGLVAPNQAIEKEAIQALTRLRFVGPGNVQLRLTELGPIIFEINPRVSSTCGVRAYYGFNEAEASLRHFVEHQDDGLPLQARSGYFMRYWQEQYATVKEYQEVFSTGKGLDNVC